MRGRLKNPAQVVLSGRVYLELVDEEQISDAQKGDIVLSIEVDAPSFHNDGNYRVRGYRGYYRVKLYDGKIWAYLQAHEFFENKEFHFSKNEYPYDCYLASKEILEGYKGTVVYKSYREHYTKFEYQPNDFKGKKGNKFKKVPKSHEE
jgi:hypothetical protein